MRNQTQRQKTKRTPRPAKIPKNFIAKIKINTCFELSFNLSKLFLNENFMKSRRMVL